MEDSSLLRYVAVSTGNYATEMLPSSSGSRSAWHGWGASEFLTLKMAALHWLETKLPKCVNQSTRRNRVDSWNMLKSLLLLPLALQPTVGFDLSNNVLPFFPICQQLSPSSHSQHSKISFYFLFPSFPASSPFLVPSSS